MLKPSLDSTSRYRLKRFGVKLALISAFALAQIVSPLGFSRGLEYLLGFTVLISAGIALYKRENLSSRTLDHWDEAALFLVLFVAVHFTAFHLLQK